MVKDILNLKPLKIPKAKLSHDPSPQVPDKSLITILAKTSHTTSSLEASECCLGTRLAHVNCVTLDIDWSKPEPRVPLSEPESR